ncbi:MAG: glucose-6-phosphate isomerase [Candidatus Staskawiczbacteria bacterium]|nr:glucose-6-phosphate isomerase [Candidatus Staskawiczbacteria bacterium]
MEYNLNNFTPDIRHLNDMRGVLQDKNFAEAATDTDLYFMYRALEEKNDLRYDITVLAPKMLGGEFNKTKGHYHIGAYPEVYTVLEGTAIYLLQKRNEAGDIEDVYAVETKAGETAIMPPFYGHVTINPSETEELKMANWVSPECKSDYSVYENLRGACYYYTKQGWLKNESYKNTPELRFEKPLSNLPEDLEFLKKG